MMRFEFVPSGPHALATSVDLPEHDNRATPGRHPTVIVVHGLTGNRLGKSYHLVDFTRRLAARGIACVRFDQAGCGESTGDFTSLTIPRMAADTQAIHAWTASQAWCDAARVGITALSLGALAALAADAQRPAKAIALWAPVFDMPQVFSATAKTGLRALLDHQGWVPYRGLRIGKSFVDTLGRLAAHDLLAKANGPVLTCHSRTDDIVGFNQSERYEQRCRELGRPCEFVPFNDADHDFADLRHREELLLRGANFFVEHLTPIASS